MPGTETLITGPTVRAQVNGLAVTFRALRHRNYRLYFFGQLVSLTGSWMQTAALMWLAFELTHQSKWSAVIAAAQLLPTFVLGTWGGVLADRWPKRSLIFATQTAFMLLAFLLAGLVFAGAIDPWQLLAVSLAAGLVQAVDLPARLAFVTDLAGRDDLMNAVALNSLLFNVARVLGPAFTGFVLTAQGAAWCFLVNGLSFVAVLWALAEMDVSGAAGPPEDAESAHPVGKSVAALLAGFSYLARRPGLTYLLLVAGMFALWGWPFLALLPALAYAPLNEGARGYSLMLSSTGVGALTAAFLLATFGSLARRRRFMAAGICVVTAALVGLSLAKTLDWASLCAGLVGFGLILYLVTAQSVVQLSAGDHNRGRVMAVWAMFQGGLAPLGNLLTGWAADRWGVPIVLRWQGIACGATALVLLAALQIWRRWQPSEARPLL